MTGVVNTTGARSGDVGTTVGTPAHTETNAANVGSGVLPVGVTGGSGLNAVSPANLASGVLPVGVTAASCAFSVSQSGTISVSNNTLEEKK